MHAGYASSDILERVTGRKIYSTKEFVPQLERTVSEPEPYFNANTVHSRWNKLSTLRSRRCQKNPRALSASQVVYRSRGGWLGGFGRGGEVKSSLVQNIDVSEDLQAKDREGNYTEAPIIRAGAEVSYSSPVVDNGNSIHITTNSAAAAALINNSKRDLLNNTGTGPKAVRTKKRNLSGSYKRTKMATVSSGSVENSEFKQAASKVRYRSGSGGQPRRERRHVSEHQFKSRSGPAITVTINSDVEFPDEGKYFSAEHICSPSFQFQHRPEDIYNNYSTSTSIYATPKEDFSPAKEPASFNMAGSYLREQIISFLQPSDNKLAMKLFGNKKAVMKEKQRQSAAGNWIIHPCSSFRLYWDLFLLILLMANVIILPVAISFFNDDLSARWIIFNCICDTVFLLDLIINFRTGIIVDSFADTVILKPDEIAKHYLRTWFTLDFISSVPFDYIIVSFSSGSNTSQIVYAGRALRMFRLVKLLSLLRLLRLSRLVRYINQWQEDIGQFLTVAGKFMSIFNLVFVILLLGHWNGCLQWLVPMLQDFPQDSWAALEGLQTSHWVEQYTWALFKALSHMLCIGFGRYPPQSTTDVWLTIVSMLTGATCYAIFVGQSTTVIQSFDTSKRLYQEKFKQVEEYMVYRKLPRLLRRNITNYYEHRYRGKMFDEASILAEVNECLHEEIVNYNCRALVAAVPFFKQADYNFVSDVVTKLEYEVFLPGNFIIRHGTIGSKMYFIQEGVVDVVDKDGKVVTSLSDGSYFGEICLLTNTKRVASVRAESYCNLFSLSVEHFLSVLERYPSMRQSMESVAMERLSNCYGGNNNEDDNPPPPAPAPNPPPSFNS